MKLNAVLQYLVIHVITLSLIMTSYGFTGFLSDWEKVTSGIRETQINCITSSPADPNIIFIGTPKALYRSMNKGNEYHVVLQVQGSSKAIHHVFIPSHDTNQIYAATGSGLYASHNGGNDWTKIFHATEENARRCLAVIVDEDTIYLGTGKGLFYKSIDAPVWQKFKGEPLNQTIYFLAQDRTNLYIATENDMYRFNKVTKSFSKAFSLINREDEEGRKIKNLEVLIQPRPEPDGHATLPPGPSVQGSLIYLATSKGIFISADGARTWKSLQKGSLPLDNITALSVLDREHIFVGTDKGVFRHADGQWEQIYKGMETNRVRYLAHDHEDTLYAATDKGVFFMPTGKRQTAAAPKSIFNYAEILKQFRDEPKINEVHRLAIDYAEVDPQKIKQWRAQARRKALLPDLSVGLDRDGSDLFHWNTGASPDELQKGRDYVDWDVSLSWDLSELVWNGDQTSIDSRSKLMVELREDILDEITRLYFERRRVQVELLAMRADQPELHFDKQMRVEELTALIDALTGGEFSKRIGKTQLQMEPTTTQQSDTTTRRK